MRKYLLLLLSTGLLITIGGYTFAEGKPVSSNGINKEASIKAECMSSEYTEPTCSQRYSCETLFVSDQANANSCNLARCESQRGKGADYCVCKYVRKGIPLNTKFPFIGNCVAKSSSDDPNAALNAFPTIISVASRMLVTIILLVGFIMIVVGGVQWASGDAKSGKAKITKVAIGFALLGMMGAILRLINPNFFK